MTPEGSKGRIIVDKGQILLGEVSKEVGRPIGDGQAWKYFERFGAVEGCPHSLGNGQIYLKCSIIFAYSSPFACLTRPMRHKERGSEGKNRTVKRAAEDILKLGWSSSHHRVSREAAGKCDLWMISVDEEFIAHDAGLESSDDSDEDDDDDGNEEKDSDAMSIDN